MNMPFWKMHGAGNDFVLFDDRNKCFPCTDRTWIAKIGGRRTGIGCEGIILIQNSANANFRMVFFNPDGNEAEMCGNGARCAAMLATELEAAPGSMTIETRAGIIKAEVTSGLVRLKTTEPSAWKTAHLLEVNGRQITCEFINTGVPHAIVEVDNIYEADVAGLGRAIRYHETFAPSGTNVNFIQCTGPHSIAIRTYERGVEDETGACGTGAIAGALAAARSGRVSRPVEVLTTGGDILEVDFELYGQRRARNVSLKGPAVHVYKGTVAYP